MINTIELNIKGNAGESIIIDAITKEEALKAYENSNAHEIAKELAELCWDRDHMAGGHAMYRINLKTGETFYDVMARGEFDMYPNLYPVIASVKIPHNVRETSDTYLVEYEAEIQEEIDKRKDFNPEEDIYTEYYDYDTIVEEVLERNNTSIGELLYKEFEWYITECINVMNEDYPDNIEEIYKEEF